MTIPLHESTSNYRRPISRTFFAIFAIKQDNDFLSLLSSQDIYFWLCSTYYSTERRMWLDFCKERIKQYMRQFLPNLFQQSSALSSKFLE